ncbi:MAG: hypothetical protein ACE5EL_09270, partial [Anaerolineae bacterium]
MTVGAGDGDRGPHAPATAPAAQRLALFGGVYSNTTALAAVLADAAARGAAPYCLGDLGGFGPHPDRVIDVLREAQ